MGRLFSPRFIIGLVALSLVVAACGGGDPTATPPPQATPTPQPTATQPPTATVPVPVGEFRVALNAMTFSFLPDISGSSKQQEALYDWPLEAAPSGELDFEAGLIRSITASPDSKTWTAKLGDNVVFSNGVTADADDYKSSFEFITREASIVHDADRLRDLVTFTVIDSTTVEMQLEDGDFFFMHSFMSPLGSSGTRIIPGDYYRSVGGDEGFNRAPIGSGPVRLVDENPGVNIVFEAVDNHWYYGTPKFKTLEYIEIPEDVTRVALLKTGRVELITLPRGLVGDVREDGFNVIQKEDACTARFDMHGQHRTSYEGYGPNPLNNIKVREGLNRSVDRQAIIDSFLFGLGKVGSNYNVQTWDPAWEAPQGFFGDSREIEYEPDRARQLIADAGWPNGFEMDIRTFPFAAIPEGQEIMEAVAVWFEDIGITVNRIPMERATFFPLWFSQTVDKPSFPRPTVSGMLCVGNRIVTSAIAQAEGSRPQSRLFEVLDLDRAGTAWRAANSLDEYVRTGREYMKVVRDNWLYANLLTIGEVFGADPEIGTWSLGKNSRDLRIKDGFTGKVIGE